MNRLWIGYLVVMVLTWYRGVGYAETALATVDPVQQLIATCAACHGVDGNSVVSTFPKLAGQYVGYFTKQMVDFKLGDKGWRNNPTMYNFANNLSDKDIESLALYYSTQKMTPGAAKPELVELGQRLYRAGDRGRRIVACMACHGPRGTGNVLANFPLLSGQHADYVMAQLKDFRDGKRKNDPNSMMRDVAVKLTDQDIEAVASYIAGLH